jgi:hypothetical protein
MARLYPNVRGCGYPPELNCEDFFSKFGISKNVTALPYSQPFPCWVSTIDSSIAMTELDLVSIVKQGCQISRVQNDHKIHQSAIKFTKRPEN